MLLLTEGGTAQNQPGSQASSSAGSAVSQAVSQTDLLTSKFVLLYSSSLCSYQAMIVR